MFLHQGGKKKVWFYIALYPVHWTAQSALHFPPLADLFIPTPFSASLGSILAMQQLRNDYSLTFPPLSIARYSFIQLSLLRRREVKENAQTSIRYQRGFEPGLSRLRVRHSTTDPPRCCFERWPFKATAIRRVMAKNIFVLQKSEITGSGWVGQALNRFFFGKSTQNRPKPLLIFWSSIPCVFCLYIHC